MKKQAGFTLIELVIVIIILGILAATAVPKFINLQTDARIASLGGVKGALEGAATIVYSKAAIDGIETDASGNAEVDGINVTKGYPNATAADLREAANLSEDDWSFNTSISPIRIYAADASASQATCHVTYELNSATDERPTITVEDSSC